MLQKQKKSSNSKRNERERSNVVLSSKRKKASKENALEKEDEEEERRLTALLFGGGHEDVNVRSDSSAEGSLAAWSQALVPQVAGKAAHAPVMKSTPSSLRVKKKKKKDIIKTLDHADETDDQLFEIDRAGCADDDTLSQKIPLTDSDAVESSSDKIQQTSEQLESNHAEESNENSAAWIDADDEDIQVNLMETVRLRKLRTHREEAGATALAGRDFEQRLRDRFQSTTELTARTDWARLSSVEGQEEGPTTSSSLPLLVKGRRSAAELPSGKIRMIRSKNANHSDPNQSVVQAVHFHPASNPENPLLLTAGLDKTLRFFQVDQETSTKVHGIHFPKLPIFSASFLGSTGNVVVSGRRSFFYLYDAVSGKVDYMSKVARHRPERSLERFTTSPDGRLIAFMGYDGYIILFDAIRQHWITDLKMNGSVRALAFAPTLTWSSSNTTTEIWGSGSDGDVYRFDLRTNRCIERFSNQDGTITSYLAASDRHVAVGAESGIVNLYSSDTPQQPLPSSSQSPVQSPRTLVKSISNLHTSVDHMRFNHDGQILAISTRRERLHGLKLVHVSSRTVFANWPTQQTPLNYVWCMDFSPLSRYLAVGNDRGECLLYQIDPYNNNNNHKR